MVYLGEVWKKDKEMEVRFENKQQIYRILIQFRNTLWDVIDKNDFPKTIKWEVIDDTERERET